MACATTTVSFTGIVVSCETRFETAVTEAFVTDVVANWVVTIDVEAADDNAPAPAGARVSFLFHSPTHLFFASAKEVKGWRCKFTIERTARDDRVSWVALKAARIT